MSTGQDPSPAAPGQRPLSRFAARSLVLLVAIAVLNVILAIVARAAAPDDPDLAIALMGVPMVIGGLLFAMWALARAVAWAEAAAIGILWLYIIEGVVATLRACTSGPGMAIHIPIAALAAAFVLWTSAGLRERRSLTDAEQTAAAALIVLVGAGLLWPYAVGALLGGE